MKIYFKFQNATLGPSSDRGLRKTETVRGWGRVGCLDGEEFAKAVLAASIVGQ